MEIGHTPKVGPCRGNVVEFADCKNIRIDDCVLYGSCATGLLAFSVDSLVVADSKIHDCSYAAMRFNDCRAVSFDSTKIVNNICDHYHIEGTSSSVQFNNCTFNNNKNTANKLASSNFYLCFNDQYDKIKSQVNFNHCTFTNNAFGNIYCLIHTKPQKSVQKVPMPKIVDEKILEQMKKDMK
jgi:hypothetical protein